MSWPTVALGDIFDIARGGSPRPIQDFVTDDPDGLNWISISDASDSSKYIEKTARRIKPSGLSKTRVVNAGDLLLTNSMSFGRPYIMRTSGCIHDGWLVLSDTSSRTHPDFMYHLLGSNLIYAEFERLAAGATVKNLNIELVSKVKVPLPPLPEQRRIAAILDAADALRAKRRAALAKLDTLAQSIFIEVVANSRGEGTQLGKFADIQIGFPFKSTDYASSGVRLCRGANVLPQRIDWTDVAQLPPGLASDYREFALKEDDIVIAMDRPWISEGFKIAIISAEDLPSLLVQRVARVRARAPADAAFLFQLLQSRSFRAHCKTTETTVPHISPTDIRRFEFTLPPQDIREAFSARATEVSALRRAFARSLATADRAIASLQHRAFAGKL